MPASKPSTLRAPLFGIVCSSAALILIACGGGGTSSPDNSTAPATSGSPTATAFSAGPITGFGSVILNGVRFDSSTAHVSDDDGVSHDQGDLRLGMVAEVEAHDLATDDKGRHGTASAIEFRSEIVGPVTAVDTAAQTLTVLGQTVDVLPTTVFDDRLASASATGLASIAAGTVVEVYGTLDATTGHFSATRVEPKPNATLFKLRGVVAGLDSTAHTFSIGGTLVSFATLATDKVPAGLANGQLVRVKLQTTPVAGAFVATDLQSAAQHVEDHDQADVKGQVTAFTSASQFSVDGIAVDASKASFPQGTAGIVLGARVEVEGSASAGTIVATKVTVETENEARHGEFELHGAIDSIDTTAKTFALRGLTVSYADAAVEFKDGTASNLAAGVQVEVKGALSADGTQVVAARIEFEH